MPSRFVTLVIIGFWLFTAGWFFVRDVLPIWHSGDSPAYTIELADETNGHNVPARWNFSLNDRPIGTVVTTLAYKSEDDTFELSATAKELRLFEKVPLVATNFEDRVRVSRDGELRTMRTSANVALSVQGVNFSGRFDISLEVRHGRLERNLLLEAPGFQRYSPALESVDPPRGSVLNPMHPVAHINGLHPGQTWRQPLMDPRTDMMREVYKKVGLDKLFPLPTPPAELIATVSAPRTLQRNSAIQQCLVIEYRGGEDYIACTWVGVMDGDVLRQEADGRGDKVVLQRE